MKIGERCIVIGNKITEVPDDHVVIDLLALNLSKKPIVIGPNRDGVVVTVSRRSICKENKSSILSNLRKQIRKISRELIPQ